MESNRVPASQVHCHYCGAEWKSADARCWLCGEKAPVAGAAPPGSGEAKALPVGMPYTRMLRAEPRKPFQYGLSTLLLIMTSVCVIGSITTMSPGLGGALIFFSLPALIVTATTALTRAQQGEPMSAGEKTARFLKALGLTIAVGAFGLFALGIALFVICSAMGPHNFH